LESHDSKLVTFSTNSINRHRQGAHIRLKTI
jgi:hypothetical protein